MSRFMENSDALKEIESLEELGTSCDQYAKIRRSYRLQIYGAIGTLGLNIGLKFATVHVLAQRGMPNGQELIVGVAMHGTLLLAQIMCMLEAMNIRPKLQELLSNITQYREKYPTIDVHNTLSDRRISL